MAETFFHKMAATYDRANKPWRIEQKTLTAIVFLLPALVLFTIFVILPMVQAASFSFFSWSGYGAVGKFTGMQNYQKMWGHAVFHTALLNNALIVAVSIFVSLPIAFLLAVLVADKFPGVSFFRAVFFIPYILGDSAVCLRAKIHHRRANGRCCQRLEAPGYGCAERLTIVPPPVA